MVMKEVFREDLKEEVLKVCSLTTEFADLVTRKQWPLPMEANGQYSVPDRLREKASALQRASDNLLQCDCLDGADSTLLRDAVAAMLKSIPSGGDLNIAAGVYANSHDEWESDKLSHYLKGRLQGIVSSLCYIEYVEKGVLKQPHGGQIGASR